MENINIPISRAESIACKERYCIGFLVEVDEEKNYAYIKIGRNVFTCHLNTLAVQIGKRKLFMSLDIKTGKGGDKISDNKVLVWNDEMMNCNILEKDNLNGLYKYKIRLDNYDFDKMEVIGIQE